MPCCQPRCLLSSGPAALTAGGSPLDIIFVVILGLPQVHCGHAQVAVGPVQPRRGVCQDRLLCRPECARA